jgi:integrase/recombinase XerD
MRFTGIARPEEFRTVTRAHVIAWRDDRAQRELGGSTVRHRLAALSSLFEYLCKKNAVTHNPVKGVKRPRAESGEGKTPALGDHQARELDGLPVSRSPERDRLAAQFGGGAGHGVTNTSGALCRIAGAPSLARRRGTLSGPTSGCSK